jgi:hypothetical protein
MINFYKPNSKNTGCGCSFKYSPKDNCVFVNLIKQASWDDSKKRGSFAANAQNPKMSCSIKLNLGEMAEIASCISRNGEINLFHDSPKQIARIKFSPYLRGTKENPSEKSQVGFSLSISKENKENSQDKTSYLMGFTFGEATQLSSFALFVLAKSFEKSMAEQDNKSNQVAPKAPAQTEQVVESQPEDDSW